MKKFTFLLPLLTVLALNASTQIPNNGFEDWTTVGSYEIPSGLWITANAYSPGGFYPVTKSTDHYPANVGNYSIRFENNTTITPSVAGCGIAMTNTALGQYKPMFPIQGHPNSFCGYYKFTPQNGDTMKIAIGLFKNGSVVSSAILTNTATVSNWTPFNLPFDTYTDADSGYIHISSYNAEGPLALPMGNSVLYVDNLSFDNLITSANEGPAINAGSNIFPNPASDNIIIENNETTDVLVEIYNIVGALEKIVPLKQGQKNINTDDLTNGIYMVVIKSDGLTERQKLIIQK